MSWVIHWLKNVQNASTFSDDCRENQIKARFIRFIWRKWDRQNVATAQGKYWEDVADSCLEGHHRPHPFILFYLPRHLCQPCNKGPPCPCAVAAGEKPQGSALQRDPQNDLIHPTMKVRWLSPCMVAILIIISYFRQNEVDRHQGGKMSEVISLLDRPSGGALHSSDGPYYRENHLSRA